MKFSRLRQSRFLKLLLAILAALLVLRAALPYGVKWYVNRVLADIPGYYGRIDDIDIKLWRGAYEVHGLEFVKLNGKVRDPLFSARVIAIAVDWRALFQGKLATSIELDRPVFTVVKGATEETSQTSVDAKWQTQVQKLYPFEINRLVARDGALVFKNLAMKPPLDASLDQLQLEVANLTNATEGQGLFADGRLRARLLKSAQLEADVKMDPLSDPWEADLDAKILALPLTALNPFADAYGSFDFQKGTGSLYFENVSREGRYKGYFKLILEGVDVVDWEKEKKDSLGRKLWESLVGGAFEVLENQPHDRFAVRLPVEGDMRGADFHVWSAVKSIFANAFVRLMPKKLENSLNFKSLGEPKK